MKDQQRPTEEDLIAVVSGWERFLGMAKTMLLAANIDAESLLIRYPTIYWKKRLNSRHDGICVLCRQKCSNDASSQVQLISRIFTD